MKPQWVRYLVSNSHGFYMEAQLETAQGASGFVSHLRSRFGSVLVWSQDEVAAVIKLQRKYPLMTIDV